MAVAEPSQAVISESVCGIDVAHRGAVTASGDGAVTTGTSLPDIWMMTLAAAVPVLPQTSVALNVTGVVPTGKSVGALLLTGKLPSSVSVAVAPVRKAVIAGSVAGHVVVPGGTNTVTLVGGVTMGALVSPTWMVTVARVADGSVPSVAS